MDKRISGLIRHFDGLASPSYVPETPLPRDPGKSASLPLAEALSIVEPGATATIPILFLIKVLQYSIPILFAILLPVVGVKNHFKDES